MSSKTTYSVRAAADLLEVHENTIRNWVSDGLLQDVRLPGTSFIKLSKLQVDLMVANRFHGQIVDKQLAVKQACAELRDVVVKATAFLASMEEEVT